MDNSLPLGYTRAQPPHAKRVNDLVDAVYVLSVRTFTDRISYVENEMARHNIRFRFMFEHDADQLNEALVAETFGPSDLKKSHQSLVLKNIAVWREAVTNGYRRVLVFEDDAVLRRNFDERFQEAMAAADALPSGWSIFLGGLDTKVPYRYFLEPGPLVELPVATTEGCVYDLTAMQRRLAWLAHYPVTQPADYLLRSVDKEQGTRQFWLRHPVVEQGSVLGIFDSHLDGGRQKHSRVYNIFRNRWNKFQRRILREWLIRMRVRF